MKRLPIGDLVVQKPRPETTLLLERSFRDEPTETVESYIFTDTIRSHMATILDSVARGAGQGFWVQAEYGAGKTHFLAALAALLADTSEGLWSRVSDQEIRLQRKRLQNVRLFPVVLSLRGEGQADALTEQSLLDVIIEKGLRPALEHAGLDSVQLSAADDVMRWLEQSASSALKADIEAYVARETGESLAAYRSREGNEPAARLVMAYCREHAINPVISAGGKSRLAHIYQQIVHASGRGYGGMLFVIDEYEGWEKSRVDPRASSQDAEFLETLGYLLPKDLGLQVYTIVASQSAMPAKLVGGQEGDRFIHMPLLADRNARDYDIIISRRVRGLRQDRLPEINDHYIYCRNSFKFAQGLSEAEFADVFPFQPRCFEIVRRITARDLPTARSGILVFHQVVNDPELLARDTLIRASDLLRSEHLVNDCLLTPVYKGAFAAYRSALEALPTLGLEPRDMPLAQDVLATLFLWYLAYSDAPRPMLLQDLAEATLTTDDLLTAEDSVRYVLLQMQTLPQVTLDEKSASFEPKGEDGPSILALFNEYRKRAAADRYRVTSEWTNSLFLTTQETRGQAGLFSEFTLDQPTARRITCRNLEYAGQIIIGSHWQPDWQLPLPKDDVHFRLVILSPDAAQSVKASDLQDPRIAVVYPGALDEAAFQSAANFLAWEDMNNDYRDRPGKEAEAVREWLAGQRQTFLSELLQTHLRVYRAGTIITRDEVAISAREAFGLASNEQRLSHIVGKLLTAAYDQLPLDAARLRSTFTATEAGKLFDGYFSKAPNTTQVAATRSYGVALGLSHPDQPGHFQPQPGCKALDLIAQMLAERNGGELPVWKVYERLSAPPYGLPYVAIQMYLLAFVRRGDPRAELTLKREHSVKDREGRAFAGDRITSASIGAMAWRPALERSFDVLLSVQGPSWNDALAYAREFVGDLHTSTDQVDIEAQTARLQAALDALAAEAESNEATLQTLERTLSGRVPAKDREAYGQLRALLGTARDGYATFYEEARAQFGTPDNLRDALRTYARLKQLASLTAQINEVKRYLDACALRPEDRELRADRDSLLAQLSLDTLAAQPGRWSSLQASFEQFKARYRNEYHKHHRDTNTALAALATRLAEAPRQLRALALLNSIEELGAPRGADLEAKYAPLAARARPCPVEDYRLVDLTSTPVCQQCHRRLTDAPPQAEVEGFLHALEAALGEQRRRLSSEAIRRVLARSGQDAVSQFLEVVQTANVAALVDVLDEELVRLIRRLLAEDGVAVAETDVLRRLARDYPTLEEGDVPNVVKRFEEILRQAFAEARKAHPGKKSVRLSLR